jgi:hypothetical protein
MTVSACGVNRGTGTQKNDTGALLTLRRNSGLLLDDGKAATARFQHGGAARVGGGAGELGFGVGGRGARV